LTEWRLLEEADGAVVTLSCERAVLKLTEEGLFLKLEVDLKGFKFGAEEEIAVLKLTTEEDCLDTDCLTVPAVT
jgi:hypothetical protein